jgi:hypothetical protein
MPHGLTRGCACCHLLLHPQWAAVWRLEYELELVMHRKLEAHIRHQASHVSTIAAVQRLQEASRQR